MSGQEKAKGTLLYESISTLLGDECGCGGPFLKCNEECCPSAMLNGEEVKTYGGWLVSPYLCGKDTMEELSKACDAYDHMLSIFDGTYEDLEECINCEGPLLFDLCPKCNLPGSEVRTLKTDLCLDCGVDTRTMGWVNRVSADRDLFFEKERVLNLDSYMCGTCGGDDFDEGDGDYPDTEAKWDQVEKFVKNEWIPMVDEAQPGIPKKFRELMGCQEEFSPYHVKLLEALVKLSK